MAVISAPLTLLLLSLLTCGLWPLTGLAQDGFAPLSVFQAEESGQRRAILVGVDRYSDPAFGSLRFASKDARYLAELLADPELGGFQVTSYTDGSLSLQELVAALQQWKQTLGPQDTALVYFSGHGMRSTDPRRRSHVFLAATDSRRSDPLHSALPLLAVQEFLESLPTQRRVLIVDACFSGEGKVLAEQVELRARSYEEGKLPFSQRLREHEAQLYATSYGRPALESEELGHGLYTWHLGQAIGERFDEADMNGDLVVSVAEAHDFARAHTMAASSGLQVPMARYRIVGLENLLLSGQPGSRRRVAMAMVSAYSAPQQGIRMMIDGVERGAFPATVLVDPGARLVEFRNLAGRLVDRGRFSFRPEQVYSVARIRDALNGGRHQLALGYVRYWLPGAAYLSLEVPVADGLRLAYTFRFPSREPLFRRMGLVVDLDLGRLPSMASTRAELSPSPETILMVLAVGPILRVDFFGLVLSLQPRLALVNLWRSEVEQPYLHWTFAAVGGNFALGFRPHNRVSVQLQYAPMLFDAPLSGGITPRVELMHRLGGSLELGF
tara:strand:- start:1561 stop:3222 length:1662 start_codon:yes stop_codon:yes gene_type:complete